MNRWLGWMVAGWISGILAAEVSWWCVVPVIMTAAWVLKRQGARAMPGAPWGDDRIAASMAQPPAVFFFRRDRTWLKPILCMVMIPMACHRTQMTTTEQTKWMEMTTNMTIRTIMAYGQILEEPRAVSSNRVDLLVAVHRIQTGSYNRPWIHLDHPVPTRISILKRRDAYTLRDWLPRWLTRAYRLTNPGLMPDAPSVFTPAWRKELLYGRDVSFMASVGRYTNRYNEVMPQLRVMHHNLMIYTQRQVRGWAWATRQCREALMEVYRTHLPPVTASFAAASTLGAKQELSRADFDGEPVRDLLHHAGLGHLLAVSGLHVGLVAGALGGVVRFLRAPRWLAFPVVTLMVFGYAAMTGMPTSATRAAIMTSIGYGAYLFGGGHLGSAVWSGLLVAAAAILVMDPHELFGIGFLLSFGAVLSLVLLTSPIMGWMESLAGWRLAGFMLWVAGWLGLAAWNADAAVSRGVVLAFLAGGFVLMKALSFLPGSERFAFTRLPKAVQSLLAAQGAIQLGVMIPLSGRFFGDYSFAGITANLVGIPLAGVYIPAAVGFALLGLVPGAGPVMANALAPVVSAMGGALLETASWATVAWASPSVPAWPWWGLGAYYAVLAVALVGAHAARASRSRRARPSRRLENQEKGGAPRRREDAREHATTRAGVTP